MSSEFGVWSLEQTGRKWRDSSCLLLMACCFLLSAPAAAQNIEERVRVWEKDPFAPPSAHTAIEGAGREAATDLSLSTILFSNERSSAVINGRIYRIGDDVTGQKIIDIKRAYVILSRGNKTYRLELKK